jgi:hypothetical protein
MAGDEGELTLNSWSMTVISGNTVVTDNTAGIQQFTLLFTLPVTPIGPSTLSGGSIQGGVTDNTGDGATLSTAGPGTDLYQGLLDGVSSRWASAAAARLGPAGALAPKEPG